MAASDALLDALNRFGATLVDSFEVADVLYGVADRAVELLGADGAGVTLANQRGELEFVSANTEFAIELENVQQQYLQGPCHEAFHSGVAVIVDDITVHPEWPIYVKRACEVGVVSVMGMPLQVGARTVGALNVYCTRAHTWDDDDLMAARVLANVATTFIIQGTKLEQSNRLNDQLQEALDSRVVIEQAKGILSGENAIDLDTSFELLRSHARNNQAALRSVAEDVVNNGLRPPMPR